MCTPRPRLKDDLEAGRFDPRCPRCGATLLPVDLDEESPLDPRSVYAATKLQQEHLCEAFVRETGTSLCALRYHNVYGPRMPRDTPYAGVASIFRSAYERGEAPFVYEDGGQRRDFIHVADVALANEAALLAPDAVQGAFNVASGVVHTVADLARALGDAVRARSSAAGGERRVPVGRCASRDRLAGASLPSARLRGFGSLCERHGRVRQGRAEDGRRGIVTVVLAESGALLVYRTFPHPAQRRSPPSRGAPTAWPSTACTDDSDSR